jgi:LysR family glycine cleavage system transcriptional activator
MAKQLPPLNWFRAFEAAARRLSFTAAAEEIGMTQSAVSQQIRALETRFQARLFQRHARGLSLTDAGRRLLPQVEAALDSLHRATAGLEGAAPGSDLLVSASISMMRWVIFPGLPGFTAHHPNLSLRFNSAIWPDEFVAARADVEIRFGSARQVGGGATLIEPNALVALKSPALTAPLTELPLIEAVGTSQGWQAWGAQAGIAGLEPRLFTDSYGMALDLAAAGNGVALASAALAGDALASGSLVQAHPARLQATEGYYLAVNTSVAAAVDFAEWLLSVFAQDQMFRVET